MTTTIIVPAKIFIGLFYPLGLYEHDAGGRGAWMARLISDTINFSSLKYNDYMVEWSSSEPVHNVAPYKCQRENINLQQREEVLMSFKEDEPYCVGKSTLATTHTEYNVVH